MNFEKNRIYHIYNQGNNRKKIFFERKNYQLFKYKITDFISPYGDILAWCLMPNHFHIMLLVNEILELWEFTCHINLSESVAQMLTNIGVQLESIRKKVS